MSSVPTLDSLPDDARLWVFGASRPLEEGEEYRILETVDAFLSRWQAHGNALAAAREWRYGRFLLVGVDERVTPPSGCSIDALVRELKGLERALGVSLVDGGAVWYREGGEEGAVRCTDRPGFQALVDGGEVGPETVVFDGSLTRLRDLRQGAWERPARDGWHARVFFRTPPERSPLQRPWRNRRSRTRIAAAATTTPTSTTPLRKMARPVAGSRPSSAAGAGSASSQGAWSTTSIRFSTFRTPSSSSASSSARARLPSSRASPESRRVSRPNRTCTSRRPSISP